MIEENRNEKSRRTSEEEADKQKGDQGARSFSREGKKLVAARPFPPTEKMEDPSVTDPRKYRGLGMSLMAFTAVVEVKGALVSRTSTLLGRTVVPSIPPMTNTKSLRKTAERPDRGVKEEEWGASHVLEAMSKDWTVPTGDDPGVVDPPMISTF